MTTPFLPSPGAALTQHRGLLTFTAILSFILGFIAITFPLFAGVALEILIGAFCLVSGLFDLGAVLFAKNIPQRAWTTVFALIRLVAGIVLLAFVGPGLVAITLVLGALFFVEGITAITAAFKMKGHVDGWVWTLISGIAGLILAGMILFQGPASATWVVGTLYGVNLIFYGISLFGLISSAKSSST